MVVANANQLPIAMSGLDNQPKKYCSKKMVGPYILKTYISFNIYMYRLSMCSVLQRHSVMCMVYRHV